MNFKQSAGKEGLKQGAGRTSENPHAVIVQGRVSGGKRKMRLIWKAEKVCGILGEKRKGQLYQKQREFWDDADRGMPLNLMCV